MKGRRRTRGWFAALAALALLLAACPDGDVDISPTPPEVPSGTIRFGYPSDPQTFDPTNPGGGAQATRDLLRPVMPALFALDAELTPVPELVREWPSPEDIAFDPFSVTLRLRSASWSDGTPITAHDVRFSWERLREGPTGNRYRFLTDVEVGGPRELTLHFDRPVRRWWALFSVDDMVLPAHAFDEGWDGFPTVSGGPFAYEGRTEGLSITLRRNDTYWGERARVETIEVFVVPNDEIRLELLARDELDAAVFSGDGDIEHRARIRGFDPADGPLSHDGGAVSAWGSTWWELAFHLGELDDPAVARAALAALDRALVAELLGDSGQMMDGIPHRFPVPGAEAHGAPAIPGPWDGGDPEEARRILEEAGYADGEARFRLAFPRESGAASGIARFVHFRLREVGIFVELARTEGSAFWDGWVPEGRADAYLMLRRAADAPDPFAYRSDGAPPGRLGALDDLADLSASAVGLERLAERPIAGLGAGAWEEAQELLAESGAAAPLARARTWIVARPGVAGAEPLGAATGPLWNAHLWRIFDLA